MRSLERLPTVDVAGPATAEPFRLSKVLPMSTAREPVAHEKRDCIVEMVRHCRWFKSPVEVCTGVLDARDTADEFVGMVPKGEVIAH
jgi:hypothetical protein